MLPRMAAYHRPSMSQARLSAVIVAHDSLSHLRATLPSLLSELGPADELIVVDNGSSDPLQEELPAIASRARLITAPGNVGFAAGANLGVAAARNDLIVLLKPDAGCSPAGETRYELRRLALGQPGWL